MTPKTIEEYIRFGVEIWLCLKEQYPEVVRNEETVRIKVEDM